jgi:hypothetical protein
MSRLKLSSLIILSCGVLAAYFFTRNTSFKAPKKNFEDPSTQATHPPNEARSQPEPLEVPPPKTSPQSPTPLPPELDPGSPYQVGERYSTGAQEFWLLEFENLPLLGYRYFPNSKKALPPAPKQKHTRQHTTQAAEKVRSTLTARNCEIFQLQNAEDIFYRRSEDHVVPAYSVAVYYLCGRERKRELWILSDPELSLIGTIPRNI